MDKIACKDCKVIPGESLTSRHRIMVADIWIKTKSREKRKIINPKIKWWNLKGEKLELFKEKLVKDMTTSIDSDPSLIWDMATKCIKNIAKEVLGESKGIRILGKKIWWWNEQVQAAIKLKRVNYKIWQKARDEESLKKYRDAKKEVKKVISNAKLKAYDNLYNRLDTKEGEKDIYKLAKLREKKTKDFNHIKWVKGKDERVLIKEEEIKERWKSYFKKLINKNNLANLMIEECDNLRITNEYKFFRRFSMLEIKNALSKIKNAKAWRLDAISIEVQEKLESCG